MAAPGVLARSRTIILAALPLGAAVALSGTMRGTPNWIDFVLTTLATAVVIGSILAAVTQAFVAHARRSAVNVPLYLIAMLTVGVVTGGGAYFANFRLPHGSWARLPAAPEAVRELAGPNCYTGLTWDIYARLVSGGAVVLRDRGENATWERVDSISSREANAVGSCRSEERMLSRWSPFLAGRIVASKRVSLEGADCAGELRVALLADGQLWKWTIFSCALGEMGLLFLILALSVATSVAVGMVVVVFKPPFGWQRSVAA